MSTQLKLPLESDIITWKGVGIDAALRHGAVAICTWEYSRLTEASTLQAVEIPFSWTAKDSISVGMKSTEAEIVRLAIEIAKPIEETGLKVAIDWSLKNFFMKTSKVQLMRLSFFMGCLYSSFRFLGVEPNFVSPMQLRRGLGLKANLKKELVWEAILDEIDLEAFYKSIHIEKGDLFDAVILSYYAFLTEVSQ